MTTRLTVLYFRTLTGSQSKYYYGVVIPFLLDWLEVKKEHRVVATKKLHNAIKHCFEVKSFAHLSTAEFEKIMGTLRMIGCRHWSVMIPEPNEKGVNLETIEMGEFLKIKMQ